MALILCIDTATEICSVAITKDQTVVVQKESHERNGHSSIITSLIQQALSESSLHLSTLDAIAISMGPGSYTGLRIGVSTAKGLCYALDRPLIAMNTLQIMALGMAKVCDQGNSEEIKNTILCPMIDARRMEVYDALYDMNGKELRETKAEVITENSFAEDLKSHRIVFFGSGATKCKDVLSASKNAIFMEVDYSIAASMASLAAAKFEKQAFEDVAYFEPYYLKDFIAGASHVKGLK